MGQAIGSTQFAQFGKTDDAGVVHIAQAFHIEDHNLLEKWQLVAYFQRFVELLIILYKQDGGAGVFAKIVDLYSCVGGIDAIGHATARQHCQIGEHPFDNGIRQNGCALARFKAQTQQARGHLIHSVCRLPPSPAAPDAQVFLTHPDLVAAHGCSVPENFCQCVAFDDDIGTRLDIGEIPKV